MVGERTLGAVLQPHSPRWVMCASVSGWLAWKYAGLNVHCSSLLSADTTVPLRLLCCYLGSG